MSELTTDGNDEKGKTKNIQRGSSDSKFHGHSRSLGTFAIAGNEAGSIEIPVYRANRKRRDSSRLALSSTDTLIGGILRNLILQSRNQVARRQNDIKRIEDELQELNNQLNEWEELLATLESSSEAEMED